MAENSRENAKGFWEGGSSGHDKNTESAGRPSGYPGRRAPSRVGVKTDIEFPPEPEQPEAQPQR